MRVTSWSATNYDRIAHALADNEGLTYTEALQRSRAHGGELSWDNEVVISYHPSRWGLLSTAPGAFPTWIGQSPRRAGTTFAAPPSPGHKPSGPHGC